MMIALILGSVLSLAQQKTADPSTYAAVAATLQPGETLTLAPGSYVGNLNLNNLNGTPSAWITIQGPASGPAAVFLADLWNNTVEIANCSYLAIKQLTLEGQHLDGPFGISAHNGLSNVTHDILIEGCTIQNYDGGQQTDGISTKTPTWRWTIRGNRLINIGTGIYLGNSTGNDPFIAGLIEGNLIQNTIGYGMQIKFQNPRPSVAGMPTGDSVTIIRNNVFIKNDAPSPDGDRPNLLVGGFPNSGPGMNDRYEIYGNLFYHNPRESLFQGSGRVSLHDNIFVDVAGTAILLQNHDLPLKLAQVYNNTIYAAGEGIYFGSMPSQGGAVVGNLVFSPAAIGGVVPTQQDNIVDLPANASTYVKYPSVTLGAMDFFPLVGKCQGTALNLAPFAAQTDYDKDFNGTSKGSFAFRGAYAGEGTNPGWTLNAGLKGGGSSGTPPPPPPPTGGGSGSKKGGGGGGGGCGATGLEGFLMLGLWEIVRRRRLVALLSLGLLTCTVLGPATAAPQASNWTRKGGSIAVDVQGYGYNPSIAVGANGAIYTVWAQHRKADVVEMVSPYAAIYAGGAWQPLGGRIGNTPNPGFACGYDPSIVLLGNTPYVAWYEGGGYGWGNVGGTFFCSSIFVSHWDGTSWVRDANSAMGNGSLNNFSTLAGWNLHGRNPRLAIVNGKVTCAWVESRPGDWGAFGYNVVIVKHLDAGQWIQDGPEFNAGSTTGSRIIDLAIADVGGEPHVAWSEYARTSTAAGEVNSPGTVQVAKLSGGAWQALGGSLNISASDSVGGISLAVPGTTPYVAWQERSATGRNQIYVKHWTGAGWAADGTSLNADPAGGEAGRPTLVAAGGTVWLAWTEGALGQPSQLYARSLSGGVWSAPEGSLNVDPAKGSADTPALAVAGSVPQLVWGEFDPASSTQQIYVKGRDATGVPSPVALSPFGASGPAVTIPDNTWVAMHPGGVANPAWNIGDEGYDSFHYDPGIKKAICYGLYHSIAVSWGENQNALLAYDFKTNRWDLLAPGEYATSEHLPGVGHDEGNSTVDTLHHLYITHGNLTVSTDSWYQTHIYDLKGHRGKRMMPPLEPPGPRSDLQASAFDPDHDLMLMVGAGISWLYDHNTNGWTVLPNSPSRMTACLVYDTKNHVFVLFGGMTTYAGPSMRDTWTLDPVSKVWTQKSPATSPPSYAYPTEPYVAYDSVNGVTLLMGGGSQQVWIYDAAADTWTRIADAPAGVPVDGTDGAYVVYNSDDKVFLVRHAANLSNVWAFRYVPSGIPSDTAAPSVPANLSGSTISTSQIDLTWTASTDNVGVTGYRIYRNGTQIATSVAASYSDTGLAASTAYTYTVAAEDAAGNVSGPSASASATTPAAPGGSGGGVTGGGSSGKGGSAHGCGLLGLEVLLLWQLRRRRLLALLSLAALSCTLLGPAAATPQASAWTQKGGSIAVDVQGYGYNPSIAVGQNGAIYAVWSQHRKADVWEMVSPYAAMYSNGSWQALGGRIGNLPGPGCGQGYDPSIAVLGNTPYVAWYEGQGYGWGTVNGINCGSSIFVSHWDGSAWVRDPNSPMINGALNVTFSGSGAILHGRNPRLTVINNKIYCAWIESRPGDWGVSGYNVVVVKHLDAGQWIQDGTEFNAGPTTGSRIVDLAIAEVGGVPHVAWSEYRRTIVTTGTRNDPGTLQTVRLSAGAWVALGGALNLSANGYASGVALAVSGTTPYVAWLERSAGGRNQLYLKHWTGTAWAADGASLNADPAGGEAGRPTLAASGGTVWLAWTEGSLNQPSQLYVRSLSGGVWSAPEGSLNRDASKGAADTPALAVAGGVPQVLWGEYDPSSATQQIYVKGRDASGVPSATPLTPFGSSGPAVTLPDNTWVSMHPGGVAKSSWGVGDESYNSFHYAPGIRKAILYGIYHSPTVSYGENQNALLAYDFVTNRWDLLAPGEYAASEHLPGTGHDEGNSTVDTLHNLYITHGNLTPGHESWYQTHTYDLKGHRGKRMMSPNEPSGPRTDTMATAFDPDHDLVLMLGPANSWLYDHNTNIWTPLANSPQGTTVCLVYDTKSHLFVLFNGLSGSHETWVLDPVSKIWTKRNPAASPTSYSYPYAPSAAYDSVHGVTLLMGGNKREVWIYDATADTWTRLADAPAGLPVNQVDGAYLVYDSDDQVFLLRHGADIDQVWAFRYVPTGAPPDTTAPSVPTNLAATAISTSQIDLSWTASTDNVSVAGYRIYVGGAQIATTSATSYSHTGLAASTAYTYTVAAYDAAGNLSSPSSPAGATTSAPSGDTQPPSVPGGLAALAVSSSQVDLSWNASTDNVGVSAYRIFRGGTQIATVTSGTSYSDVGLSPSTAYSYTVVALDAAGNASAASGAASASTLAAAPGGTGPGQGAGKGGKTWGCGLIGLEVLLLLGLRRRR